MRHVILLQFVQLIRSTCVTGHLAIGPHEGFIRASAVTGTLPSWAVRITISGGSSVAKSTGLFAVISHELDMTLSAESLAGPIVTLAVSILAVIEAGDKITLASRRCCLKI